MFGRFDAEFGDNINSDYKLSLGIIFLMKHIYILILENRQKVNMNFNLLFKSNRFCSMFDFIL
jgi:hypothetical protein